jgi:two-component system cell cycle sensor histidine kinase/response regulator CckA
MLPRIIGEHIQLELDLSVDQPLVRADKGQLEQLVINVAANGRDAINELGMAGGRVSIRTSERYLPEGFVCTHLRCTPGPHVCLEICDTGVGMDEQVQQHMFEPFFTTKDVDKGTGLGLAMVYGIVEEMGGCIDLVTGRGQGAHFCFLLPVADAEQGDAVPEELMADADRGEGTILVIEDQDAVRLFASQMLEHLGYSVLTCAHPSEALALLQSEPRLQPDLLLVDVIMPVMSGPELVRRLRLRHHDLRVLYMSGYADTALRQQTGLQPGDPLLVKPFTVVELARQVKAVLDV